MELMHLLKRVWRDDTIVDHLLSLIDSLGELRVLGSDISLPAWITCVRKCWNDSIIKWEFSRVHAREWG